MISSSTSHIMIRPAFFVIFLATFTISCLAAPLNDQELGRRALSASSSESSSRLSASSTTSPSASASTVSNPGSSQQNQTSTPSLSSVPNWAAYENGTIGYTLNQLLNRIASDAPQRWVTASPIAHTLIGSTNSAGSNKDLEEAVNTLVDPGKEDGSPRWVDKYIHFLLAAGNGTILTDAEAKIDAEYRGNATTWWATEQMKLVNAYEAAHPGNITWIGSDVGDLHVNGTTLGEIRQWAAWGGDTNCTWSAGRNSASNETEGGVTNCPVDSDGPYTGQDYNNYLAAASHYYNLQQEEANFSELQRMASDAGKFRITFDGLSPLGILNLTMKIGGEGTYAQYKPAWTATVIGAGTEVGFDLQILGSNLENGANLDTSKIDSPEPLSMGNKREATNQTTQGFSVLKYIAHSINSTTKANHADSDSPFAAAASKAVIATSDNTNKSEFSLAWPLTESRTLLLFSLQEGSWAENRDEYIRYARRNTPKVAEEYFGAGSSGLGPIGRHWTHLVLSMSVEDGDEGQVDLLGMVYDVLPGLK
ncbi:hypothetical protein C8R43DRAFT_979121 [Mycena crocata]|nr:hypothetical protein C8R43DRAFT_979121 [Mycena crocata]